MKIKSSVLQSLVAKAIKGASNNKMIPITGFMGIEVENKNLILTTTDGNNILKVKGAIEEEANFYTVVNAEYFSKLVGKITKEFIELSVNENYLVVEGNGIYRLEIPVDSEGNIVKFDNVPDELSYECDISPEGIQSYIRAAGVAIASTMDSPLLTGYYLDEKAIVTTDSDKACYISDEANLKSPMLLDAATAELLMLFNSNIKLSRKENELLFVSSDTVVYCKELPGKENYPVKEITSLMNTSLNNSVKVSKDDLINALDRMSLFVDDYDENGVVLTIQDFDLILTSQKSNATEKLKIEVENINLGAPQSFTCLVDIEMLLSELKAIVSDKVEIHYGNTNSIQLKDGKITLMLSLMTKED